MRLLVVDDEKEFGAFVQKVAEPMGYEVVVTADGNDFKRKYDDFDPTVVVLDMVMPVMDGYATAREIKDEPRQGSRRIVGVTASAFLQDRRKILASGIDDLVIKPVDFDTIRHVTQKHLGSCTKSR